MRGSSQQIDGSFDECSLPQRPGVSLEAKPDGRLDLISMAVSVVG